LNTLLKLFGLGNAFARIADNIVSVLIVAFLAWVVLFKTRGRFKWFFAGCCSTFMVMILRWYFGISSALVFVFFVWLRDEKLIVQEKETAEEDYVLLPGEVVAVPKRDAEWAPPRISPQSFSALGQHFDNRHQVSRVKHFISLASTYRSNEGGAMVVFGKPSWYSKIESRLYSGPPDMPLRSCTVNTRERNTECGCSSL
jgi:hypothetical protein